MLTSTQENVCTSASRVVVGTSEGIAWAEFTWFFRVNDSRSMESPGDGVPFINPRDVGKEKILCLVWIFPCGAASDHGWCLADLMQQQGKGIILRQNYVKATYVHVNDWEGKVILRGVELGSLGELDCNRWFSSASREIGISACICFSRVLKICCDDILKINKN